MDKKQTSAKDKKEKKKLLFLHGYLCDGTIFAYQIKFFSKYYDCYYPDLPGFGANKDMPYSYNLDDYIGFVKEYMKKNNIVKPDVIAHSFGGRIAIKASANDKELFSKIVLTGSAGMKPKRTIKYKINKFRFNVLKKFVSKDKLTRFYSSDYNKLNDIMKGSFKKIINEFLDEYSKKIENPVFIINGIKDTETPLCTAKILHKNISGSEIYIIKDSGHFCFLEKPNEFNFLVKEFLLN